MLVSNINRFITIDIPKTATRSLRETLLGDLCFFGKTGRQHFTARQAKVYMVSYLKNSNSSLTWDDYYKYSVVRNPWDRAVSLFSYYLDSITPGMKQKWGLFFEEDNIKEDFCSLLKKRTRFNDAQEKYIINSEGDIMVDQVANFDNLQEEFNIFCEKVGIEKRKLRHSNKKKYKVTKEYLLNQESVDIIADREKFVIDLMGYNF